MDVGTEIRRLREEKGWSQAKLAAGADMGVSGISQIETGARNPSAVTLSKIAEALGAEVGDLFPKGRRSSLEPSFDDALEDERPASEAREQERSSILATSIFAKVVGAAADGWAVDATRPDLSDDEIVAREVAIVHLLECISGCFIFPGPPAEEQIITPRKQDEPIEWDALTSEEQDEIFAVINKLSAAFAKCMGRLDMSEAIEQGRNEFEEWKRRKERHEERRREIA